MKVTLSLSSSRFKYVLVNTSTGLVQDQTLWSDPIRTNRRKWVLGGSESLLGYILRNPTNAGPGIDPEEKSPKQLATVLFNPMLLWIV